MAPKPDLRAAAERFHRGVEDNIGRYGRTVIGVFPDGDKPGFSYTIGNALKGLPELLIVGGFDDGFKVVLNALSEEMIKRGRPFGDGEKIDIGAKFPTWVCRADPAVKIEFTVQATNYLESEDYEVMQVVVCDKEGRFPWDPGCAAPYSKVKIYRRLDG